MSTSPKFAIILFRCLLLLSSLILLGCVEKNYSPEELDAQSRGNKYYWLYKKKVGLEVPKGWEKLGPSKVHYYRRVAGDCDYYFVLKSRDGERLPVIGIRLTKLKFHMGEQTIAEQVATKKVVDALMFKQGVAHYNLNRIEYDRDRNIFLWNADYKLYSQKDMYAGHSLSTMATFTGLGIQRYKKVTTEMHVANAHYFIGKYELVVSYTGGISYFSDTPSRYNSKLESDFWELVDSIKIK